MNWIKDAIGDMFKLLMSLSLKARTILVASIIFLFGGYYILDRYLDYKTEALRITAQPQKDLGKSINEGSPVIRIEPKQNKIIKAEGIE